VKKTRGEDALIEHMERAFPGGRSQRSRHRQRTMPPCSGSGALLLGPGDDAAVLRVRPGYRLVATVDEMCEGVHFLDRFSTPELIAGKLLRMNLSDLAAMGEARPLALLTAAGLPRAASGAWARRFVAALRAGARRFRVAVAGGNITRSADKHFSMTLLGECRDFVTRYGARPGDLVYSLGPLGLARAGLELLLSGASRAGWAELVEAFWRPRPMLAEGALIGRRGLASAMLDNSDGLYRSLGIIARLSGCRVKASLPDEACSPALRRWAAARKKDWRLYALAGGEDYGLVFCCRPSRAALVGRLLPGAVLVGEAAAGRGVEVEGYGGEIPVFEHF